VNEFRTWLEDGAHGEMHYMKRGAEKRSDPQRVLPEAKSIIVLALNYWQGNFRRSQTAATGRIARYAWGDDYHDVITAKLDKIENYLREFAANKNVTSIRGRFWNVITQPRRGSAGMARARCWSIQNSEHISSSRKFSRPSSYRQTRRKATGAELASVALPLARRARLRRPIDWMRGVAFLISRSN